MTVSMALLLIIVAAAVVLFSLEHLPADVISLGLLLTLTLTGLLPPEQAFAGFGSDTAIMIFCILVLTAALVHTGVAEMAVSWMLKLSRDRPQRLVTAIMAVAAGLSAFISNTATTALLAPVVIALARRTRRSISRLLMPLAFASILASSVTLISSSTNIVISGLMSQYGLPPLGMFELSLVGLPIAVVGVAYMLLVGRRLIPDRTGIQQDEQPFGIRPYTAEVTVLPASPLVGKTLRESNLGQNLDLTVLRVLRDGNHYLAPRPDLSLHAGDELLVEGQHNDILRVKDAVGIAIKSDVTLSDLTWPGQDVRFVEAIVLPNSPMLGRTLKSLDLRRRYNVQLLGINRHGRNIYRKLSQIAFRVGDQLLLQGAQSDLAAREREHFFQVLGMVTHQRADVQHAPQAILIFAGTLVLAALNILTLPVAVLLGTLLAFLTRCITPAAAYREVEWKAIIVIGSMLALGSAMQYTGTAQFLAAQIAVLFARTHPVWLLSAFFALTMLLTQPMSNQAAAVVVLPVALQTATQLGLNERAMAIMIAVGASCSFITPLEPACLIVFGPGRYKFTDFVRVGLPLTLLIYGLAIALVPLIWPLQ
ncbi:MAG: SLC13 family permease [Anaerolineae bacterium]|nr:SLC13 family permease [Anaerolineae bacterium]